MIILDTENKSLELILAGAVTTNQLAFTSDYEDIGAASYTPGSNDGVTTGAVAVTAVAAPAASTVRQIKLLTVFNLDTVSATLTVQLNNNSTTRTIWKGALAPNEALNFTDGQGFNVLGTDGALKIAGPSPTTGGAAVLDQSSTQRIFMSDLDNSGTFLLITNTAYWVYVGRSTKPLTLKYVEVQPTTVGAGAQTAEIALASSPSAPNKAAQVLTKLAADGTLDSLTVGTGVKRNTASLDYSLAAGIHLWAGMRTAMATTQPTVRGLSLDMAQGNVLSTATPGALTGAGPWTGAIIAASTATIVPDLRITLD